jgi:adenylate cyclase class 2
VRYEVEQKFPVTDLAALEQKLSTLGTVSRGAAEQLDCYFAHPSRDFTVTDEALRIRTVGQECSVTYKGPRSDGTTKTRQEIELPLQGGVAGAERFANLLMALGFRPVAEVRKRRQSFNVRWKGCNVCGALDNVDGLGTFVELELAVEGPQVPAAQQVLQELADELGLRGAERRSYLELLERRGRVEGHPEGA